MGIAGGFFPNPKASDIYKLRKKNTVLLYEPSNLVKLRIYKIKSELKLKFK